MTERLRVALLPTGEVQGLRNDMVALSLLLLLGTVLGLKIKVSPSSRSSILAKVLSARQIPRLFRGNIVHAVPTDGER